jgi:hypothetical protein
MWMCKIPIAGIWVDDELRKINYNMSNLPKTFLSHKEQTDLAERLQLMLPVPSPLQRGWCKVRSLVANCAMKTHIYQVI